MPATRSARAASIRRRHEHVNPSAVRRPPLRFSRGRRSDIETSRRWIWTSDDGRWQIQRLASNYGLPEAWLVLRRDPHGPGWQIVSRHRRRKAAFNLAKRLARQAGE